VFLYQRLKNSIEPEGAPDFAKMIADYKAALLPGIAAFRAQQAGETADKGALEKFARVAQPFDQLANLAQPLVIPPPNPEENRNGWKNIGVALLGAMQTGEVPPAAEFYARMGNAYAHDDAAEFNGAIAGYKQWLAPKFGVEVGKGRAEFYFNQVKSFLHATIIYIFAFVLAGGALLTFGTFSNVSESLRRAAYYLVVLAFIVHTFGLVYRMVLEARPPVTNLYSSAVFIGWAACLLGLILERFYKVGLGSAVAALIGFITLLIAHNLAVGGDTMEMMRAVLDTNFWLATHVVTVTLGYASTFVAGLLAITYIVLGIFTPLLTAKLSTGQAVAGKSDVNIGKVLVRMTYAIVCFATLFSFVGTVLGGIWADQSWGRFWGWDPKENGALLIVLWNAIILHARWGKLVGDRGLMNLAVVGNIITSFSWFGVNMLGIGLHSYGFMDAAFKWLMLFILLQIAIIALGSLPLNIWKSFHGTTPPAPPAPGGTRGQSAPAKA
jgi:cytochrome c-type biogenesis protein CcsB